MTNIETLRRMAIPGPAAAALAAALLLAAAPAAAAGGSGLLRAERDLLGPAASRDWRAGLGRDARTFDQVGGDNLEPARRHDEVGAVPEEEPDKDAGGPSHLGDKVKAGALSAVLPGAGQFYNGQREKAYIMAGVEVAIWTAWFVFDAQADGRLQDAKDYAGIYAGAGGTDEDYYWRAVGRYMDSDDYNADIRRQDRASDENLPGLIGPDLDWRWVNAGRQNDYRKLYDDADSAYKRRDFMLLFAIANRVVSMVDAVVGAGSRPGALETEVLGMGVGVEVLPSWRDPGARCVVSRSF